MAHLTYLRSINYCTMRKPATYLVVIFFCFILVGLLSFNSDRGKLFIKVKRENKLLNFDFSVSRLAGVNVDSLVPIKDWKKAMAEIERDLRGNEEFQCKNMKKRGNWVDCNTFPFVVRKPCLVYSFGIDYDFRPDDAFASLGCQVFSFDPSMTKTPKHTRKSGVNFFPIGIAGRSMTSFSPRIDYFTKHNPSQKWEIKTLHDIMIFLGHQNRHLDWLKLDIEEYEWESLESIFRDGLASRIRQIAIEFHITPETPKADIVNRLRIFKMFKDAGFRKYYSLISHYNVIEKDKLLLADCGFVNLKFNFTKFAPDL